jgi:sugar phosphate isomerase/epimerase
MMDRRTLLGGGSVALALGACATIPAPAFDPKQRIGVTTVGFRERFASTASDAANADLELLRWPAFVRETFDVPYVECWARHFAYTSLAYCATLRAAAADAGTEIINIQLDPFPADEVDLSSSDVFARMGDIEKVMAWMDRAKACGAPFLRANTDKHVEGRPFVPMIAADSFYRLAEHGQSIGVTILVENHGGYSRDIRNVEAIVRAVDHPFCRAVSDWGNSPGADTAERIASLAPIMDLTALVSAKGRVFDETTWTHRDYDVAAMTEAFERGGFTGVYSIELYNVPPPSDPVAAVRAMIAGVSDGMMRART